MGTWEKGGIGKVKAEEGMVKVKVKGCVDTFLILTLGDSLICLAFSWLNFWVVLFFFLMISVLGLRLLGLLGSRCNRATVHCAAVVAQ